PISATQTNASMCLKSMGVLKARGQARDWYNRGFCPPGVAGSPHDWPRSPVPPARIYEYMALQCGIVGLPNVGKSTLFNALTKAGIAAENYPFCTIEPNVGVVEVP